MSETIGGGGTAGACPVCGARGGALRIDGVERSPRDWIQLAECGRCDHRWTRPLPEPAGATARGPLRVAPTEGDAWAA